MKLRMARGPRVREAGLIALILSVGSASVAGASAPSPEGPAQPPTHGSASLAITAPASEASAGPSEGGPTPIDLEKEKALAFLQQLEQVGARLEAVRAQENAGARAALGAFVRLQHQLAGRLEGADADRLYETIVRELNEARPALRRALDTWRSASDVPREGPPLELPAFADLADATRIDEVRALRARIVEREAALREEERAVRWAVVELRARRVRQLNQLRLEAMTRVSAPYRARLLGFSREGIEQLGREIEQAALSARAYVAARGRELHRLPDLVRDALAVGAATYVFLKLAGVLVAAFFLRGRGPAILEGLRQLLLRPSRGVKGARRSGVLLDALEAFAPWTLFLSALEGIRWGLGDAAAWPELRVSYRLAFLYGVYRLATDVLYGFVLRVAQGYRLTLDAGRRDKLVGSARTLMRVLAGIAALLYLSEAVVGRGYLYHLVQRFAWVVVLIALFRILVSWQTILVEAFLAARPEGRRAALVRATRDRWYGVFVAAGSFTWLVGHALVVLTRDFVLGFDQTRRAMAFFFRRRIEKQAERQGYSDGVVEALPEKLTAAFAEGPVSEERLLVDNFPGADRLRTAVARWREGQAGGSFVVTGERGIGKTTWLGHVEIDGLTPQRVAIGRRLGTESEVAAFFGSELGHPEAKTASLGALARWLAGGEPRLLQVDLGQNLFLGTVGGYRGVEAFTSLVEATCHRVFWLCCINTFAWEHLSAVRPELRVFRFHQALPGWSETQIRELIRTRTAASGVRLTYDDLMVGPLDGVSGNARFLETEEGYTRLLWDYSDGNPRVALHFWLRSLVPESRTRARVRLCKMPSPEELQRVGETGLFLLAAIVIHENLNLEEAVSTTRYSEPLCRIALGRLLELDVLKLDDGCYRLTSHWHRAAVRLLTRLNLLPD